MIRKICHRGVFSLCLVFVTLAVTPSLIVAQDDGKSIVGYWKQLKHSVYIRVTEEQGVLVAEIVRNDWRPALVGKIIWSDLSSEDNKTWTGNGLELLYGNENATDGEVPITVKLQRRGTVLITRRVDAKKRVLWKRTDPILLRPRCFVLGARFLSLPSSGKIFAP